MTYHVLKPGTCASKTFCGRRAGTPGGVIYPGVHGVHPHELAEHRYPEAIEPATCKRCLALSGVVIGSES